MDCLSHSLPPSLCRDVLLPLGYTYHSLAYAKLSDDDIEGIRIAYTCEDTALPVTDVMLLVAPNIESLQVPTNWEVCKGNLAPLLLGKEPSMIPQEHAYIALAYNRGKSTTPACTPWNMSHPSPPSFLPLQVIERTVTFL